MRSQVRFVMHPADEADFVRTITGETGTILVDGPKWSSEQPPIVSDAARAGNYLIIWNPKETPPLKGTHHCNKKEEWWYCENEYQTIQFLRSGFQYGEPFLFEGRIAIATTDPEKVLYDEASAPSVERRFKTLSRFIKKSYTNGVIIWQNPSLPRSKTNPLTPAKDVWVGPHALRWLQEEPKGRWIQQFRGGLARGYILDLVESSTV